eukprot:3351044-Rhodomonas_salina.1
MCAKARTGTDQGGVGGQGKAGTGEDGEGVAGGREEYSELRGVGGRRREEKSEGQVEMGGGGKEGA